MDDAREWLLLFHEFEQFAARARLLGVCQGTVSRGEDELWGICPGSMKEAVGHEKINKKWENGWQAAALGKRGGNRKWKA